VGAELFRAGGQTDRHDATNSRFRNFGNAPKNRLKILLTLVFRGILFRFKFNSLRKFGNDV
jgi:hypothetical protein